MINQTAERTEFVASEFMRYLIQLEAEPGTRLPPIGELAAELGISSGKLREQLEVARELGLVEVRPKTGIRVRGYSFYPTIRTSLRFALALDPAYFDQFGQLRNQVEASYWYEAVARLTDSDKDSLRQLMSRAWAKLEGDPIQIPHVEHRELHLTIYSRLENEFVTGLLEAYWDAYEAAGLNRYEDYLYLREVWTYHGRMVEAIVAGDYEAGYRALVEHTELLRSRPKPVLFPNGPGPRRQRREP
jgi:DNA-binding FadR family transcriptional regulator